ncbi:MAG: neutral/alkaline non-lysosomal ceramidase N-terminal domain-containing protein [Deltaproteobacteria bacterium]|nr:neutral/alkaline non-lysosomal ceramidase N-terminal domain-containing protein [Deltaproteobacteria bacterium]
MRSRRSSKGFILVFSLGMLYLLLSLDWRGRRPAPPPRVVERHLATGTGWSAGAARVDLTPPLPTLVAGYPAPRPTATQAGPLLARAVVLKAGESSIGLVSLEVLEVPAALAEQIRERGRGLGLVDVIVSATHSHTSFGGYDQRLIAEIAATGRHDPVLKAHVVARAAEALQGAQRALQPARMRLARSEVAGVSVNRHQEAGEIDSRLTVLGLEGPAGELIARIVVFGSHATLAPRKAERLDGDWPGRAMSKLEEGAGVGILLQGAMGDTTSRPPAGEGEPAERMGARIAQSANEALLDASDLAPTLAYAAIEFGLPRAEADHAVPGFLRMPAANVLHAMADRKAQLSVLRLPGLVLAFLPAEPTAGAARALREGATPLLAPGEQMAWVSFAQGYVGYVEPVEVMKQGAGEAKRALFGPELIERIAGALAKGLEATAVHEAAQPGSSGGAAVP